LRNMHATPKGIEQWSKRRRRCYRDFPIASSLGTQTVT